jgi:hypothetical protein
MRERERERERETGRWLFMASILVLGFPFPCVTKPAQALKRTCAFHSIEKTKPWKEIVKDLKSRPCKDTDPALHSGLEMVRGFAYSPTWPQWGSRSILRSFRMPADFFHKYAWDHCYILGKQQCTREMAFCPCDNALLLGKSKLPSWTNTIQNKFVKQP